MGVDRKEVEHWENERKKIPATAIRIYKLILIHGDRTPRLWDEDDSYTDTAYER